MSNSRFPIFGATIPPMLGRSRIVQRIWNDLSKTTPSNLSIIGPQFVGKTVIMNALAELVKHEESPYKFVLHWHLGHVAPTSNEDFIKQLCEQLCNCLVQSEVDTSEYRNYLVNPSFGRLAEVMEFFIEEGWPILMLWDGLDKPLGQGKLTGHLWDQMRTLFYGKKHKIVTATRKPLIELLRSEDAISSPFWNIFDINAVRIGAFDDQDCMAIIGMLSNHSFESGAITELENWTAGFPPLFLEMLNLINSNTPNGQIDNEAINQVARKALLNLADTISVMWRDCPSIEKDLYVSLVDKGHLLLSEVGRNEACSLIAKGLAKESGNKLTASCRLLREYIKDALSDQGSMVRLFGAWDDYQVNIRGLLERRLAHISPFDNRLHRWVNKSIEFIPEDPDDCLRNLEDIEGRAMDLIWTREFGESMSIPQSIVDYWERVWSGFSNSRTKGKSFVERYQFRDENKIPFSRGQQCGILQILTGSTQDFESRAKYVTKNSYVLINAIHSYRNRKVHHDGENMHVGVAIVAIMTCLELLSCLELEQ